MKHEGTWTTLRNKTTGEIIRDLVVDIGDHYLSVIGGVNGKCRSYNKRDWEFKLLIMGVNREIV